MTLLPEYSTLDQDMWYHIYSFLPLRYLVPLRSLNRAYQILIDDAMLKPLPCHDQIKKYQTFIIDKHYKYRTDKYRIECMDCSMPWRVWILLLHDWGVDMEDYWTEYDLKTGKSVPVDYSQIYNYNIKRYRPKNTDLTKEVSKDGYKFSVYQDRFVQIYKDYELIRTVEVSQNVDAIGISPQGIVSVVTGYFTLDMSDNITTQIHLFC